MKISALSTFLFAAVLVLAGCSGDGTPSAAPTAPSPSAISQPPPTTPTTEATAFIPPTDIPDEVMLPAAVVASGGSVPEVVEDVTEPTPWPIPEACAAGLPMGPVAQRSVQYGRGEYESLIGIHRVVTFADEAAAAAELDRITQIVNACPDNEYSAFTVESLPFGNDGFGLVVAYAGGLEGDAALGYYVTIVRRGNAISGVGLVEGESLVGEVRSLTVSIAQTAWDLLCRYDQTCSGAPES